MNGRLLRKAIRQNILRAERSRKDYERTVAEDASKMLYDLGRHFDLFMRVDAENVRVLHDVLMMDITNFLLKSFFCYADEMSCTRHFGEFHRCDIPRLAGAYWSLWSVVEISCENETAVCMDCVKYLVSRGWIGRGARIFIERTWNEQFRSPKETEADTSSEMGVKLNTSFLVFDFEDALKTMPSKRRVPTSDCYWTKSDCYWTDKYFGIWERNSPSTRLCCLNIEEARNDFLRELLFG